MRAAATLNAPLMWYMMAISPRTRPPRGGKSSPKGIIEWIVTISNDTKIFHYYILTALKKNSLNAYWNEGIGEVKWNSVTKTRRLFGLPLYSDSETAINKTQFTFSHLVNIDNMKTNLLTNDSIKQQNNRPPPALTLSFHAI